MRAGFVAIVLLSTACAGGASVDTTSARLPATSTTSAPTTTKAGSVIGPGSLLFAVAMIPDEPMMAPYGVDVGPDGTVYVFDAGNNRVVRFDHDGAQIGEWGSQGSDDGAFESLGFGSLAVDETGRVFVVDNGNFRIQSFDADGDFVTHWGGRGDGEGEFERPIGIAVGRGLVYVTDDASPYVQVFDVDGVFVRRFGGPGELSHPTGIAVDPSGSVFVADYENRTIQRFDPDGTVTGVWRNPSTVEGLFRVPEGLAIADDGTVLVTGYEDGTVWILPDAPSESEVWEVAGGERGTADGQLTAPVDLAIDDAGSVFVSDQRNHSVQRFDVE